jgi:hypothetical protein
MFPPNFHIATRLIFDKYAGSGMEHPMRNHLLQTMSRKAKEETRSLCRLITFQPARLKSLLTILFAAAIVLGGPSSPELFSAGKAFAADYESYTYKLSQSTGNYVFWTTTPSERVFKDSAVPADTGSGVKVYAAKNEFEPFQIVVKPSSAAKGK